MNENFSENLKKARQDARMTQAEVAKIVGVAKNTYCNWEQGTRKLERLKDLYVEELIDLTAYKADRARLLSELDKLTQETPERRAEDLQALLRPDLWDLYGAFTNAEKRMFWRGIIERIEYGNDKKFTVHFVR